MSIVPTCMERAAAETMKLLQLNLNHCEAAQALLTQTIRELGVDVAILSEPYRHYDNTVWTADATGTAAIWTCGKRPFQETEVTPDTFFVRAKIDGYHIYSCYAPPSLTIEEYDSFLDRLTIDARGRSPVFIAGDFNAPQNGAAQGQTGGEANCWRP